LRGSRQHPKDRTTEGKFTRKREKVRRGKKKSILVRAKKEKKGSRKRRGTALGMNKTVKRGQSVRNGRKKLLELAGS